ncbi:hypothetical protein QJQ45_018594, partial [Haematococcus lacustris]
FVKSTETVGDLTTTCLTVVPLGCYATKTECCAKLAASWQMLSIAADPACEGSVLEVSVAGRSLTEAMEFVSGNGTSQVVISDVGLDYWSSMQVGGAAAAAASATASAAGAAAVSFYATLQPSSLTPSSHTDICITMRAPCNTLAKLCNSTVPGKHGACLYSMSESSIHHRHCCLTCQLAVGGGGGDEPGGDDSEGG